MYYNSSTYVLTKFSFFIPPREFNFFSPLKLIYPAFCFTKFLTFWFYHFLFEGSFSIISTFYHIIQFSDQQGSLRAIEFIVVNDRAFCHIFNNRAGQVWWKTELYWSFLFMEAQDLLSLELYWQTIKSSWKVPAYKFRSTSARRIVRQTASRINHFQPVEAFSLIRSISILELRKLQQWTQVESTQVNLSNLNRLSKSESVKIYWLSVEFDWFK